LGAAYGPKVLSNRIAIGDYRCTGDRTPMRHIRTGLTTAGVFTLFFLNACGGGGAQPVNVAPTANAGTAQTVNVGSTVVLNGSASTDSDGSIAAHAWVQTAGTAVTLTNANTAQASFVAPQATATAALTFRLTVTDNQGSTSAPATVTITVNGNAVPLANAGSAQTVAAVANVTLNGTASNDPDGSISGYAWTQTGGAAVVLNGAASAQPTFAAPAVTSASTLTFSLVVTDNRGAASTASTVTITVSPSAMVSGIVRFSRVAHSTSAPFGLNYGNPILQPARGVIVNVMAGTSQTVLATGVTSASGAYSFSLPANTNITIQVVARMQRDSSQPLPRWDVRVQNGTSGNSPYTFTGAEFNSSAGTQNIDIPTGIASNGTATGVRASGPFAVLDTIYTAMQTVLGAAPNAAFPQLYVDWGTQTDGTHFTITGGHHIALLSDLTQDADEFDQHTIAHEFGHYLERNFARADNIGGSHGLGDKLDMRVAFGEGFGYAFAGIVLNDPVARDGFVSGGVQVASGFNMETNPAGSAGCWCSEPSVFSILWDLYDNVSDGSDSISLGFGPIWDVLTNAQRNTPSVTSIFSFITALKAAQPSSAGLINTLVSAQNTNSVAIEAFATNETFLPFAGMTLPLIPTITRGGAPVVVRSIDDGGHYNKAGNRSLLRFTAPSSGNVTVTLATSNTASDRDPDFLIWNNGVIVWGGTNGSTEHPETETFVVTAGQTYIIDAYDCANGCVDEDGTAGDYNLTATIN
jgi:hypothetical protein